MSVVPDGSLPIGPVTVSWNYRDNFFGHTIKLGISALGSVRSVLVRSHLPEGYECGVNVACGMPPLPGGIGRVAKAERLGETAVQLKKGDLINRVWDSRWTPRSQYSGPFGGSYSPTGSLQINSAEAAASRGLTVSGVLNNGQRGAIYEVTRDTAAVLRTSIGGTADELVIAPRDRGALRLIEDT